jgi:predicted membrane-bound spermidine synthase
VLIGLLRVAGFEPSTEVGEVTSERGVGKMIARALGGKKLARVLVVVALVLGLMVVFEADVASLTLAQEAGVGVCLLAVAALIGGK